MPLQATSGAASYDAFGGGVPVVPAYIEEVFSTFLYTGNGGMQTIANGIELGQAYGGSVYFGSGNYISAASNAAFEMGGGDFTVEAWVYPNASYTTYNYILGIAATNGLVFYVTGGNLVVRSFNGSDLLSSSTIPALNAWTHVAATRSGTTLRIFVNGVQTASTTNSTSFNVGVANIGNDGTNAAPWLGSISNFRLVKGTAVYTSNFTPSTIPLTAISGTSLLTCRTPNTILDYSSNSFTITTTGSPTPQNGGGPFTDSTAGKGAMTWIKGRSGATDHRLTDTARGATKSLASNSTAAEATETTGLTAFGTTGFTIDADADYNTSAATYVSWTFRKQPKFFDVVTWTGSGANRTISHSLGSVPACIIVKRTDTTADWAVYHRSLANTQYLVLNSTAAAATGATWWNSTTPTSAVFSVGTDASVNASGGTYVAYLFAHDAGGFGLTGTDNVISCGSFTADGAGSATVNLGYEPQWLLIRTADQGDNWRIYDTMREWTADGNLKRLFPNLSNAEQTTSESKLTATGFFGVGQYNADKTYIYIAIRRGPMKVPTSGTSVFTPALGTSASTIPTFVTNFPVDLGFYHSRANTADWFLSSRLQGGGTLNTNTTLAEAAPDANYAFDSNTGWGKNFNSDKASSNFRRAPSFFDEVCYTGTGVLGRTVAHNLTVVPELIIIKDRGNAENWVVYSATVGNDKILFFNRDWVPSASGGYWNNTTPTASVFSVCSSGVGNNDTGAPYVAYLFATCAGVSKVFSYTGNGSSQTINCGFTAGSRWVMIKRTDSAGDWYVWDSARGIVAGNDPHLSLNSTAAEVTTDDSVDTDSTGFIVNQLSATNVNVSSATYIGIAIA